MKNESLIRQLRENVGHTLESLSDFTGISITFLKDLEKGKVNDFGNGGKLFVLAEHLEVDADELLDALDIDLGKSEE